MPPSEVRIWGLEGMPEINPGDNLCETILAALRQRSGTTDTEAPRRQVDSSDAWVRPGSILVVAQKVVSKAEGRLVDLETVRPSVQAQEWASRHDKDPRMVEAVLRETKRVVRMDRGVLISETHHGFVCANAGVDASNAPKGTVVLLPEDPDRSARELRSDLEEALKVELAVIISDTFGRPWRQGLTNVALGVAGLAPLVDYRGKVDFYGRPLRATVLAVADELAAAAELVMGKTLGIPVVVIEGFQYQPGSGSGRELIRSQEDDLFR
jgi:coenzyme F420-0:L-glutamate ligase / coenzyme F420-1:gamma-L-glutamate ligase